MSHSVSDLQTQSAEAAESIQDWLIDQLAVRLDLDPDDIDIDASFESFGMESAEALVMLTQLEQWLGRTVPPVLVWNYPTIAQLSQRLSETEAEMNN
jgi:acyl carrier protein